MKVDSIGETKQRVRRRLASLRETVYGAPGAPLPALVPHLVGFHPESSLVLLGLAPERRTVQVTIRIDLPHPGDAVVDVVEAWSRSLAALPRSGALEAILVVYPGADDDPWHDARARDLPFRDLVDEVAAELADAGLHALDAVCLVGERLRSYWCRDTSCCPLEGRPVDPDEVLRVRSALVVRSWHSWIVISLLVRRASRWRSSRAAT